MRIIRNNVLNNLRKSSGGLSKMGKNRNYIGVSQDKNGSWNFTVRKANGKMKTDAGYSTAKVAALMRDEYILKHSLDEKSNFPVKRMAKMRNDAYEQMFGTLK
ncbi:MAG: hypothetical protein QTN59_06580 [Candidatus Electrothrix communis]|nr:MAG: hypothetical protein QTN59_06580 [Candidatus Electrothrix communis]